MTDIRLMKLLNIFKKMIILENNISVFSFNKDFIY